MLMQSNLVEYWTSELEHLFLTRLAKFYHLFPVHSWGPSRPESCFHYHHDSSKGKIFLVIYPSLPLTLCPCLPSYVHLPPSPSLLIRTLSKSHILSFSSFPPLSPSPLPLPFFSMFTLWTHCVCRSGSFPLFNSELLRLTSQEEPPLSRRMSEPAVKDFESLMHAQGAR